MLILGIEGLNIALNTDDEGAEPSGIGIGTSFFNKDPLQNKPSYLHLTMHVKITLLGFNDVLKQSALDVTTTGESAQSIEVSPVHNHHRD